MVGFKLVVLFLGWSFPNAASICLLGEVCGWEDKHWLLLFILNISVESLLGRLGHGDQTIVDTHSEILISRQMPSQDLLSDHNTLQWILMSEKEILVPEIEIEYVHGKLRIILCAYPRILWRQLFSNAIAKWHSGFSEFWFWNSLGSQYVKWCVF